jgi:predicted metal-dependent peptidase
MFKESSKFNKNSDEIISDCLYWISKFYPSLADIIRTIYPKSTNDCDTMAVTKSPSGSTLLLYNPEFVIFSTDYFNTRLFDKDEKEYGNTIICNIVKHEIYHILLNHLNIMIQKKYELKLWNIATDTVINSQIEWGEYQFSIHGAHDYETLSKKDLSDEKWKSYEDLRNHPFWHCFGIDIKTKKIVALVSPSSIWFSYYISVCENISNYLDSIYVKNSLYKKKDFYKQKSEKLRYMRHFISAENGSLIFDIDGFKNLDNLTSSGLSKDKLKKANKIWDSMVEWLDIHVVMPSMKKTMISRSDHWYNHYKDLHKLFLELFDILGIPKPEEPKLPKSDSFKSDKNSEKKESNNSEEDSESQSSMPSQEESHSDDKFDKDDSDSSEDGISETSEENDDDNEEDETKDSGNDSDQIGEETKEEINRFICDKLGIDEEENDIESHCWSDSIIQREGSLLKDIRESYHVSWEKLFDERIGKNVNFTITKTFYKPNRRWGMLFPGNKKQYKGTINIAIDTSGSVTTKTLSSFFNHLVKVKSRNKDLVFNLVLYNSIVYDIVYNWIPNKDDIPAIKRSGTNFTVAINCLYELFKKNKGLNVMFTDGHGDCPLVKNYSRDFQQNLCWVIWPRGNVSNKFGDIIEMTSD